MPVQFAVLPSRRRGSSRALHLLEGAALRFGARARATTPNSRRVLQRDRIIGEPACFEACAVALVTRTAPRPAPSCDCPTLRSGPGGIPGCRCRRPASPALARIAVFADRRIERHVTASRRFMSTTSCSVDAERLGSVGPDRPQIALLESGNLALGLRRLKNSFF